MDNNKQSSLKQDSNEIKKTSEIIKDKSITTNINHISKQSENDKITYEGGLERGKRNGMETLFIGSKIIYRGHWKKNIREGEGISYEANGDIYIGVWRNGNRNQGVCIYNNGDKYEGSWENEGRYIHLCKWRQT